ncbi:hypothetical protein DYI37_11830 [Fulvimarina endophytica]|uniref:DUF2946 domain-containing protein n=1 Tax=Fulvimarina endophytica TaxID=2293836 RepID=A0A371X387_9HYPH|nr:hypothetical protein [Fulvimarina endophytica]RFC63682.1 hypothetical protein DYI37_11830 [Fulvimarina endophytica]
METTGRAEVKDLALIAFILFIALGWTSGAFAIEAPHPAEHSHSAQADDCSDALSICGDCRMNLCHPAIGPDDVPDASRDLRGERFVPPMQRRAGIEPAILDPPPRPPLLRSS